MTMPTRCGISQRWPGERLRTIAFDLREGCRCLDRGPQTAPECLAETLSTRLHVHFSVFDRVGKEIGEDMAQEGFVAWTSHAAVK